MTTLDSAQVQAAADAIQSHRGIWATQYDGRGGVRWEDDGGLLCSCGTAIPRPEGEWARPWKLFYLHAAEAVLQAVQAVPDGVN